MSTLFIATANAHKVEEIRGILGPHATLLSQRDTTVRLEVEETGDTFEENARIKAATWAAYLACDVCDLGATHVLADDSGLEVDALNGAPGVHSARYAALDDGRKGNSPDAENNAKLLRNLAAVPSDRRKARFRCVLALAPVLHGASPAEMAAATRFFSGSCEGRVVSTPGGAGGFGYDPLFIPDGHDRTFAELGAEVKNRLSHRARALAGLKEWLAGLKG